MKAELVEKLDVPSVIHLFWDNVETMPDADCVHYKTGGTYKTMSWKEMADLVYRLASYLLSLGAKKKSTIAIFSENRYEWWIADLAALSIGAITVPIYATNSQDEAAFVLKDSGATICFCGDSEQYKKITSAQKELSRLKHVFSFDSVRGAFSFSRCLTEGKKKLKEDLIKRKVKALKEGDTASILYTSGTTGNPKGVVISHYNFVSNVRQLLDVFGDILQADDIWLSFLPLSHALERTTGYYTPIGVGASVAFAENFQTIQDDMKTIRPTVIISVPRLYEKIHAGIQEKLNEYNPIKRFFINRMLEIGRKTIPNKCNHTEPTPGLAKKLKKADEQLFSPLKEALGLDRTKISISGGGPLSYNDAEFFWSIGLNVFEGYGLTECSPVTHVNPSGKTKLGTVGPPLVGTQVRISDEGEVLINGPQVTGSYYKIKNSDAFTKDGFFRTGDIGTIDEDGYLTITGRIKDIMVTSGGKNISPQNIELKLKESPYVENIAIVGDRMKFISAIVSVDHEHLKKAAQVNGISYDSVEELVNDPQIYNLYEQELGRLMGDFSRVEQVKHFKLVADSWSQDSGELTPTLKVKRRVINEKYKKEIEDIYSEE